MLAVVALRLRDGVGPHRFPAVGGFPWWPPVPAPLGAA